MDFPAIRVKSTMADSASQVNPAKQSVQSLVGDFFAARTALHKFHLKVTGIGSFAAHKTLSKYDKFGDFGDRLTEEYQGASGSLVNIELKEIPDIESVEEVVLYLSNLKNNITKTQSVLFEFSELVNLLDEVKSFINGMKYKLIYLK